MVDVDRCILQRLVVAVIDQQPVGTSGNESALCAPEPVLAIAFVVQDVPGLRGMEPELAAVHERDVAAAAGDVHAWREGHQLVALNHRQQR